MKQVIMMVTVFILWTAAVSWAILQKRTQLGPTLVDVTSTTSETAGGQVNTLAAAGAGIKNCLTQIDLATVGASVFRVLDGGTTIYAITLAANGSLVREFDTEEALCGSNNTRMEIKNSTSSAGTYQINYRGFTY